MDQQTCEQEYGRSLCVSIHCFAALSLLLLVLCAYQYLLFYCARRTLFCQRQAIIAVLTVYCICECYAGMSAHYIAPWNKVSILFMLQEYTQLVLFTMVARFFILQAAYAMSQPTVFRRLTQVLLGFVLLCATGLAVSLLVQQLQSDGNDAYSCRNEIWLYLRASESLLAGLLVFVGFRVRAELQTLCADRSLIINFRRITELWCEFFRVLISLLTFISAVAMGNDVFFYVDTSHDCTKYFKGSQWVNAFVWSLFRLVMNFMAVFYFLYIFWVQRELQSPVRLTIDLDGDDDSVEAARPLATPRKTADDDFSESLELSPRNSQSAV